MKMRLAATAMTAAFVAAPAVARQLTIDDVTMLSRVSAPAVSPEGHWLVWQQRETDLAIDGGRFDLWRLDLTRKGGAPEKLVAEADVNETAPQFSNDGRQPLGAKAQGKPPMVWRGAGVDGEIYRQG